MKIDFLPIKTRKFIPKKDKGQLFKLLDKYLPSLNEKDVVLITSKIVSIHQGRIVKITHPKTALSLKRKLIKKEADFYFKKDPNSLAVKHNLFAPYAGIDRSNAKNHYILLPKNPHQTAKTIWQYLKNKHNIKNLGIIIPDSFCLPFRWGHMGISLGFFGFNPLYQYENQKDIFGRKLTQHSQSLVDALSAISVIYMGEGAEATPLLITRGFNKLKFSSRSFLKDFLINPEKDIYSPLLDSLTPSTSSLTKEI